MAAKEDVMPHKQDTWRRFVKGQHRMATDWDCRDGPYTL